MLGDDDDDGLPAIGRTRHDVIRIDDARLIPMDAFGPEPVVSRRAIRHDLFADAFTTLPEDGSVVVPAVDGSVAPLSAVLPRLLGAHWTGWGLDGVDGDGVKVFTDPAAGLSAPHAVLVRRDALSEALARTGTELTLAVTVSDMRASFHGSRPVTVVLTAEA